MGGLQTGVLQTGATDGGSLQTGACRRGACRWGACRQGGLQTGAIDGGLQMGVLLSIDSEVGKDEDVRVGGAEGRPWRLASSSHTARSHPPHSWLGTNFRKATRSEDSMSQPRPGGGVGVGGG